MPFDDDIDEDFENKADLGNKDIDNHQDYNDVDDDDDHDHDDA